MHPTGQLQGRGLKSVLDLSKVLISPAQHQIHHSSLPHHHDRNFGSMFAIWDGLFKTLYIPATRENVRFGLSHQEDRKYQSLARIYLVPLAMAWQRLNPARNRSGAADKAGTP